MARQEARRVLIVAMHLEDLLSEMGHHVVACAAQLDEATKFADQADIDFAILDINLGGETSFPVAEILRRRGISFVFATGYGTDGLVDDFRDELTLQKPYEPQQLKHVIEEAFARVNG